MHPQVSLTECSFQLNWICLDLGAFYRGFEKGLARRGEVSKNVVWFFKLFVWKYCIQVDFTLRKVLHWSYSLFKVESALWKSLCFGWKFCCMVDFGLGLRVFSEKDFSVNWNLTCSWVCDSKLRLRTFHERFSGRERLQFVKLEFRVKIEKRIFSEK